MPAAPATVPHALGQVALVVDDIDRAVTFYRDGVGLPFLFQYPGLAFFSLGATRLMLSLPEKPEFDHPGSILYLTVGDIEGAHARMTAAAVPFEDEPHVIHRAGGSELWMTFFKDPDANVLALMQEKPAAL